MANITDQPPQNIFEELEALKKDLSNKLPPKHLDHNVLIATWNIRAFGDLTEQWTEVVHGSPKSNLHVLLCITEIVSLFDVIALQEMRGNEKAHFFSGSSEVNKYF